MRLCYGTFATVLKMCAKNGVTQVDLHRALLSSYGSGYELDHSISDPQAHRWCNCLTSVNNKFLKFIDKKRNADPDVVVDAFEYGVMELIDPNKKKMAALAIHRIIREDDSISPEVEVDLVNKTCKTDLLSSPISVSSSFFAGIFMYAVSIGRNRAGAPYVSKIIDDFSNIVNAEKAPSRIFNDTPNVKEFTIKENPNLSDDSIGNYAPQAENADKNYMPEYAILPIYLVLDTSYSMQEENRFDMALSFLPRLLSVMIRSSYLSEKILVEVITFDEIARVDLPLGGLDEIEEWISRNKKNPIVPAGDYTYYGKAFEKLTTQIRLGVRHIQSKTIGTEKCRAYRPVVFFITDGKPNDERLERYRAFSALTDQNFEYRPNLICVGVGDVNHDDLVEYGAGRYQSPTGYYMIGNKNLVIVPKDGTLPSQALGAIVPALVTSIVQSFSNAANVGEFGGMPDVFNPHDDWLNGVNPSIN